MYIVSTYKCVHVYTYLCTYVHVFDVETGCTYTYYCTVRTVRICIFVFVYVLNVTKL